MKLSSGFLKRHSLVLGIMLMFLLTWPIDLANLGVLPFQVPSILALFKGWGFVLAALIMTGLTLGKDAVFALLKRFLIWRVGWTWYLAAFLLLPALFFIAILLHASLSQKPIDYSTAMAYEIFGASASVPIIIVPYFIFEAISNGEEIGWRGYVLPRLQVKYSALVSSLITGVFWGFWHLPGYLVPSNDRSFMWFLIHTIAAAVLYTWTYNNTKGSLLLVTLLHASGNTAGVFLPIMFAMPGGILNNIVIMLEVIVAVLVTVIAGPAQLSRTEPKQVQV